MLPGLPVRFAPSKQNTRRCDARRPPNASAMSHRSTALRTCSSAFSTSPPTAEPTKVRRDQLLSDVAQRARPPRRRRVRDVVRLHRYDPSAPLTRYVLHPYVPLRRSLKATLLLSISAAVDGRDNDLSSPSFPNACVQAVVHKRAHLEARRLLDRENVSTNGAGQTDGTLVLCEILSRPRHSNHHPQVQQRPRPQRHHQRCWSLVACIVPRGEFFLLNLRHNADFDSCSSTNVLREHAQGRTCGHRIAS